MIGVCLLGVSLNGLLNDLFRTVLLRPQGSWHCALKPHLTLVIKELSLGMWLPVLTAGIRELLKLSHITSFGSHNSGVHFIRRHDTELGDLPQCHSQ